MDFASMLFGFSIGTFVMAVICFRYKKGDVGMMNLWKAIREQAAETDANVRRVDGAAEYHAYLNSTLVGSNFRLDDEVLERYRVHLVGKE